MYEWETRPAKLKENIYTSWSNGTIAAMPQQLRTSLQNSRFLGDSPVHFDAHTIISHTHYEHTSLNGAMAAPTEHQVCLIYSPKVQVSKPEKGTIAAMPRQRSVLLPEAHASNAFQPPTAKP